MFTPILGGQLEEYGSEIGLFFGFWFGLGGFGVLILLEFELYLGFDLFVSRFFV